MTDPASIQAQRCPCHMLTIRLLRNSTFQTVLKLPPYASLAAVRAWAFGLTTFKAGRTACTHTFPRDNAIEQFTIAKPT